MTEQYDSSKIEVLKGLEPVRKRPGMYLDGDLDNSITLNQLVKESICHAVDEYVDGNCTKLKISLCDDHVCIEYDAGMSLKIHPEEGVCAAEIIMTTLYACRNMKKHLEVGEKYCKIGITILTALTEKLVLETASEKKCGTQTYSKGVPISSFEINDWDGQDYTKLEAWPDKSIFGSTYFDFEDLENWGKALRNDLPNLNVSVFDERKC